MSLILRQTRTPAQRPDMRGVLPETLLAQTDEAIARTPIMVGNRETALGDLFAITRGPGDEDLLVVEPADDRLDFVGTGLTQGRIQVLGDVGDLAGRAMSGGELQIDGSTGDLAGSGLQGGVLHIHGNAGVGVGSPAPGERRGQQGGLILVRGSVGERAGERQRRGMLLIEGDAGDLLGHRMIAGTIVVRGQAGCRTAYGMRRGTIVLGTPPLQLASTLAKNGSHRLTFLPMLLQSVCRLTDGSLCLSGHKSAVERHVGDLACDGRGEVLILPADHAA